MLLVVVVFVNPRRLESGTARSAASCSLVAADQHRQHVSGAELVIDLVNGEGIRDPGSSC